VTVIYTVCSASQTRNHAIALLIEAMLVIVARKYKLNLSSYQLSLYSTHEKTGLTLQTGDKKDAGNFSYEPWKQEIYTVVLHRFCFGK